MCFRLVTNNSSGATGSMYVHVLREAQLFVLLFGVSRLDRQREGTLFIALQGAHVDDVARNLFVEFIAHTDQDAIFHSAIRAFSGEAALDAPGGFG